MAPIASSGRASNSSSTRMSGFERRPRRNTASSSRGERIGGLSRPRTPAISAAIAPATTARVRLRPQVLDAGGDHVQSVVRRLAAQPAHHLSDDPRLAALPGRPDGDVASTLLRILADDGGQHAVDQLRSRRVEVNLGVDRSVGREAAHWRFGMLSDACECRQAAPPPAPGWSSRPRRSRRALTLDDRLALLCEFTDLALNRNPELRRERPARTSVLARTNSAPLRRPRSRWRFGQRTGVDQVRLALQSRGESRQKIPDRQSIALSLHQDVRPFRLARHLESPRSRRRSPSVVISSPSRSRPFATASR